MKVQTFSEAEQRESTSISLKVVNPINIWLVVWNIWIIFTYVGNNSQLTKIFQRGWNHQPDITQVNRSISVINLVNVFITSFIFFRSCEMKFCELRTLNIEILMQGTKNCCPIWVAPILQTVCSVSKREAGPLSERTSSISYIYIML